MSDRYAGGAAFPGPSFTENGYSSGHDMGMSLRDWFAGQALSAIIAKIPTEAFIKDGTLYDRVGFGAYHYADAMLAARDRDRDPV